MGKTSVIFLSGWYLFAALITTNKGPQSLLFLFLWFQGLISQMLCICIKYN